jgi:4-hydroxy-tetrahydrodipicolinate synthase
VAPTFRLEGVFSVLPTAFHDDGSLDLGGTAALTRVHVDAGITGLTSLGVMGEAAELAEDERNRVLATVIEASEGRPVIVGVTGPSAAVVAERSRDAADAGVTAVMVSPTPTLGLRDAVAAATAPGLPVVVQDYPAGSGVVLTIDDLAGVADAEPLVVGVKAEAPPTSGAIEAIRRRTPRVGAVGGLGGLFLIDELRAGATGTMTGLALPEQLVAIVRSFPTDPEGAERRWASLLPLIRFEAFPALNLAARKEVWRLRGVIRSATCRRVGAHLDDRARDDVRRALDQALAAAGQTGDASEAVAG